MSHLHSRRRPNSSPSDSVSPKERHLDEEGGKERKPKGSSDLRYALGVVGSFLLAGLALGYLILHHKHSKVILHVIQDPWNHGSAMLRGHFHHEGPPRFVTVVMPSVVNPSGRSKRLRSIADTWGARARAIFVMHNLTEFPSAPFLSDHNSTFHVPYPQLLLVPPEIGPDQGVPRLNYVIRTVHTRTDPDFAFFVNDHTFVIPQHLCHYLSRKDPSEELYSGHALSNGELAFNSGAAGYVLSRSTMAKLVKAWDEEDPKCVLKKTGDSWLQGNPGLVTAQCLKESLNISVEDSRHHKRLHRFHAFGLIRSITGTVDEWYNKKHVRMPTIAGFDESYTTLLKGVDCCSEDSISFHYVEHSETRALHHVRQALLENPYMSDHELKSLVIQQWPVGVKDLGGYSRGLPEETSKEEWAPILTVLRNISSRRLQVDC